MLPPYFYECLAAAILAMALTGLFSLCVALGRYLSKATNPRLTSTDPKDH